MISNGGKEVVGIFRLAPDKDDCNWTKKQLNDGEFEKCDDVNIFANLIKVWFRELPEGLLDCVEEKNILKIAEMKPGETVMKAFETIWGEERTKKNIFLWLLDLCCEICENEAVNKMTTKNIAICVSPNLSVGRASEAREL